MSDAELLFPKPISDFTELETYYNKNISDTIVHLKEWHGHLMHPSVHCYVIGNGTSRKDLDLTKTIRYSGYTKKKSYAIGCNYIYKEFECDLIVAQDTRVLFDLAKDDVQTPVCAPLLKYNWLLQNNKTIKNFYPIRFPTYEMTRWKTGELALYMACILGFNKIIHIAFDGGVECVHRNIDGVSNIDINLTQQRINRLHKSFIDIQINKFEDNS